MFKKTILALTMIVGVSAYAAESGLSSMQASEAINNSKKTDQVALGVQAGSLSGLNAQYWVTNFRAWSAAVTFTSGNTGVLIDHRWFDRTAFSGAAESLAPFVGVGALAAFGDRSDVFLRNANHESFALAAQVPVGLEWLPPTQRFSVFGELAPSLEVSPIGTLFLTADVGARFFF